MKRQGHPPYQEILFVDSSTGYKFVCGSTLQPKDTEEFEGKTYPVYRVPISSASHPFFTQKNQLLDTEGRVDKFNKRYSQKKQQAAAASEQQAQKEKEKKKK